jgi:hypothetical protein
MPYAVSYHLTVLERRGPGAAGRYRFQAFYDKISRCRICGEVV